VLVLGLPRGGIPVAAEVARRLAAELDAFTVRKLGAPRQPEFAIGAIATGGIQVVNQTALRRLRLSEADVAGIAEREGRELARQERAYRDDRPPPAATGRTVVLVDDGVATGATMVAAARTLRTAGPALLVAAAPVASVPGAAALEPEVDALVCLATPADFTAVGACYRNFDPTTDDEVRALLASSDPPLSAPRPSDPPPS